MIIETDGIDPVIESGGDKAHRVARSIIGLLPASGPALEVFNSIIEPPIEKRKLEWMLTITKVVNDLNEKFNFEIERLAEDEQFISILLYASQVAVKNHQKEKLDALKTALINTARNTSLTSDQQFSFLSLIDEFTPTHIKILKHTYLGFAWSPAVKEDNHSVWLEFSRILLRDIIEFKGQGDYIFHIVNELQSKKLFQTFKTHDARQFDNGEISVMGTSEWGELLSFKPAHHKHIDLKAKYKYVTLPTELGISFLNYISDDEQ